MPILLREIHREFRWIASSRLWLALCGAVLAIVAWGAVAGTSSALSLVGQFQATLQDYQANGENIAEALSSPSEISGPPEQQTISNPLRYDLDQAAQGLGQLTGTGAVASTLSLCALLFFPTVGLALGLFMGTHDTRSGSIAFRWPQSGSRGVTLSKPVTLLLTMTMLGTAISALIALSTVFTAPIVTTQARILGSFAVEGSSVARTSAIWLLSVLIGTAFACLGLFVGVVTQRRTVPLAAFVLIYFLAPMAGPADPRNMVALAGEGTFSFVGRFRPQTLGDLHPGIGILTIAVLLIASAIAAGAVWRMRARLPSEW
jgi:hypothetical protein